MKITTSCDVSVTGVNGPVFYIPSFSGSNQYTGGGTVSGEGVFEILRKGCGKITVVDPAPSDWSFADDDQCCCPWWMRAGALFESAGRFSVQQKKDYVCRKFPTHPEIWISTTGAFTWTGDVEMEISIQSCLCGKGPFPPPEVISGQLKDLLLSETGDDCIEYISVYDEETGWEEVAVPSAIYQGGGIRISVAVAALFHDAGENGDTGQLVPLPACCDGPCGSSSSLFVAFQNVTFDVEKIVSQDDFFGIHTMPVSQVYKTYNWSGNSEQSRLEGTVTVNIER